MAQKKSTNKEQLKSQKSKVKTIKVVVIVLILAIAVFFIYNNFLKENNNEVHYYKFIKEGELTFSDSTGNQKIKIDIEIADDEYQRQLGLMNRQSMDELNGMLFIFPEERFQSFWMLNTLFSLDMLFINSNKEIVTIHKNTKPLSEQSYPSSKPAQYVLEVNAGFCDRHNIKEGDKVFWIGHTLSLPK
jgi:uncharacterized membrane protein (UPF0127 family)